MDKSIIERRKEKIMAGTILISNWEEWRALAEDWNFDPYETSDFGIDEGGGNSTDFEYIGDRPKEE